MMPQSSIAHFRLTTKLGEGGMGAVYRATDTKLNRDVAIKILPDALADDADYLARFTREAQVLASLNHPNIAAIYGVEERAIVMELVEGESPAGPVSADEALPIVHQLIDALEYAHDRGIVHRDLKPANLKLTPDRRLKVLDFGLAKALSSDPAQPRAGRNDSPTLTMRATMAGVIMGTASYMSPEQARGHAVDKRADIWSFGVVVYELLTGRRLFDGGTVSDTLAAVLREDLDLTPVPPRFRKLLAKCLTRDPLQRLRDISGARLLLEEEPAPAPVAIPAPSPARWPYAVAAVAMLATLLLAAALWRATRPAPLRPLVRLDVLFDPESPLARSQNSKIMALSPDGTRLAVTFRSKDGRMMLGLRSLDQRRLTLLAGTEDATSPFFSPDGQWIGFTADNQLKKISVNGGTPVVLGEANSMRGAYWAPGGVIYLTQQGSSGPVVRIPENGGTPVPVTKLGPNARTHRWPELLPGGQALLYTSSENITIGTYDEADIEAVVLKTGEQKRLVHGGFSARFVPVTAGAGYLVYLQKGTLLAAPFDVSKLALTGPAAPVLADVDSSSRGGADLSVSANGTLVFHEGHTGTGWPIVWLDASGRATPLHSTPGAYFDLRVSPDGKRLLCSIGNGHGSDIWIDDIERDSMSRLTSMPGTNQPAIWAPDGKSIFFGSSARGRKDLYWAPADGSSPPQLLLDEAASRGTVPWSVSPDGKVIALYSYSASKAGSDIFTAKLAWDPSGRPHLSSPEPFISTPFVETEPVFSPDSRWLAYTSNETGSYEIYVRAFPGPGARVQISNSGGVMSVWSRTAHQLFFRDPSQRICVVDYSTGDGSFRAGKPRVWSETRVMNLSNLQNHDLAPDGKRMAIIPAAVPGEKDAQTLTVLLNFADELRRRFAEGK